LSNAELRLYGSTLCGKPHDLLIAAGLATAWGAFLFAPLLWLLQRAPNVTLGASLLLYALVHVFGWSVPGWPSSHWAFNPMAWQLLVVLGAWWMIEGNRIQPWVRSRAALVLAVLVLLFSLVIALSWRIKPLEARIPQALTQLLYPVDKSNLAPLRLLHFLAIAVLSAWLVPRGRTAVLGRLRPSRHTAAAALGADEVVLDIRQRTRARLSAAL
jgi:hypothetical protein